METLRIPIRYRKQISRLNDSERAWLLDSLFALCAGIDVEYQDSIAGDTLELIWRDAIQMENRNTKKEEMQVGKIIDIQEESTTRLNPKEKEKIIPGDPEPERKGSEVNRSEVKGNEVKRKEKPNGLEKNSFGNSEINEMLKGLKLFLKNHTGATDFRETIKMQRMRAKHFQSLLAKIGQEEFRRRLTGLLEHSFHAKNCNSMKYLYEQMKAYVDEGNITSKSNFKYNI